MSFKVKIANLLKSSAFGRWIYPFVQNTYRAYAIPKKRRRLQLHGFAALNRLHQALSANHIPYYCDYGTLLGFVRDHGFMKHDDDIDISIPVRTTKATSVLKILLASGFSYVHSFDYEGRLIEFTVADKSGVTIDVFFPISTKKTEFNFGFQPIWEPNRLYPNEKANTLIRYLFVNPTKLIEVSINGCKTIFPENAEDVLASEYGKTWKIPDANFSTVNDRIHEEMPEFAFRQTLKEALAHAN